MRWLLIMTTTTSLISRAREMRATQISWKWMTMIQIMTAVAIIAKVEWLSTKREAIILVLSLLMKKMKWSMIINSKQQTLISLETLEEKWLIWVKFLEDQLGRCQHQIKVEELLMMTHLYRMIACLAQIIPILL